jgi:DHA2 family multidrug resistance protein
MGMIFIPMTTLTLSSIKKEEMGNATSIFNLVRNLGGSLGVAFVSTMLSSRSQFHQSRLIEHLTQFDPALMYYSGKAVQILQYKGLDPHTAFGGSLAVIYNMLQRQSYMIAFNDTFYFLFIMIILTIPLIFLMRYVKHS